MVYLNVELSLVVCHETYSSYYKQKAASERVLTSAWLWLRCEQSQWMGNKQYVYLIPKMLMLIVYHLATLVLQLFIRGFP